MVVAREHGPLLHGLHAAVDLAQRAFDELRLHPVLPVRVGAGVERVLEDGDHIPICGRPPRELGIASSIEGPRKEQAFASHVEEDLSRAPQPLEQPEDGANGILDSAIGIHHQAIAARPDVANGHTDPKLPAPRLRDSRVDEALPDECEFELAHRPFQPQEQTIVWDARIVDAVTVDDERADETAQLEQVVPIASVPRESGRLEAEDGAHCSLADAADQIAETGTIHRPARGAAEIRVDHSYVPKAVAPREVDERVLAALALEVLLHLRSRRLTDVDNGATFKRLLRKLTKRHR